MRYAACGIKEVRARRWWPAYELGTYHWIWQARLRCWLHRKLSFSVGETWIEERSEQPPAPPTGAATK
jgi:hypothetical protein